MSVVYTEENVQNFSYTQKRPWQPRACLCVLN